MTGVAMTVPLRLISGLGILILSLVFTSCKSKKNITETEPLRERSAAFLLKRYERNEFQYDWVGMKISAEVLTLGETQSFKANIRMKKDSVIWISISPALGIEVLRVLITPDSVKYVSKIPENKHYYLGGFNVISEISKMDIDFATFQDILLGNAVGLEKDEGKFRSEVDENKYLLISKYKRKVKKAVGMDDKDLEPDDTIVVNMNDKRVQKAVKKSDESDLIISRYWLEPDNFHLVRSLFYDILNMRNVDIEYSDFKLEGEQYYPANCRLNVKDARQTQEIRFEITKINTDKSYDFPFEIPEDFERKF
jgi:Domain of unknown function (DUF4292)